MAPIWWNERCAEIASELIRNVLSREDIRRLKQEMNRIKIAWLREINDSNEKKCKKKAA